METKVKNIVTEFPNRKWSQSPLHKLLSKFHHASTVDCKPAVVKSCKRRGLLKMLIQPSGWY